MYCNSKAAARPSRERSCSNWSHEWANGRCQGERGSQLVELGLIALPLLMLLFGTIEGGRLMFTFNQVNDAARQGARAAIVDFPNATDSSVTNAGRSSVDGPLRSGLSCIVGNDTDDRYAEVTCTYSFQSFTNLVPFSMSINRTSRMYVP